MHLVLLADQQPLGHWVLPAVGQCLAAPAPGVWLQVPPTQKLSPAVAGALCWGTCHAVGQAAGASQGLHTGQLLLHLPSSASPGELYWLKQLRPGGQGWLLSKERTLFDA